MPLAIPAMAPEKELTVGLESLVVHTARAGKGVFCRRVACAGRASGLGGPWSCVSESRVDMVCMARVGLSGARV